MKKLLVLMLLITAASHAQELTADTPATVDWLGEILKALLIGLTTLVGFLVKDVLPLFNSYLKAHLHFRGSAVVADALTQAIAEMTVEVQRAMADGVITDAEKAAIKTRAREIAKDKLQRLSGFYKSDLVAWIDEQLDVGLGKLLLLAGSKMK